MPVVKNLGGTVAGRRLSCALFALSIAGVSWAELESVEWTEGDLVVSSGTEVTIEGTENLWNTSLDLHGTMNVKLDPEAKYYVVGGSSSSPANTTLTLGSAEGDDAVLNILQGKMWARYGGVMYADMVFGSSSAASSVKLNMGPLARWSKVEGECGSIYFREGLQPKNPEDDAIDAITLDRSAELVAFRMYQYNEKPVRITFTNSMPETTTGYRPLLRIFYNGSYFNLKKPGGDIILRGNGSFLSGDVTKAPIYMAGHSPITATVYGKFFGSGADNLKACVRTEGECDFVFETGDNSSSPETPFFCELNATNFIWGHKGDFIIPSTGASDTSRTGLRTSVSRALPHGPQTGIVRVESTDEYATKRFIDLYGTTQSINGLKLSGGSQILNLAEAGEAELVFGEDDTDGTIDAAEGVADTVACRKIGTGELTASSTKLPKLTVEDGTLTIKGDCSISRLAFAGGKLKLDAMAKLECDKLVYTGRVEVADGASLIVGDRSEALIENYDFVLENDPKVAPFGYVSGFPTLLEEFRKSGSGTMYIPVDKLPMGPIAVEQGGMSVTPPACGDQYWRFVFKKTSGTAVQTHSSDSSQPAVNVYLVLGKLHLVSDKLTIANLDSTYSGTVAADALGEKCHSFTHAFFNTRNVEYGRGAEWNNGRYVAASMDSWWSATAFTNQELQVENPGTWETITFRLGSDAGGIVGYMMSQGSNANSQYADPRTWVLESSADADSVAAGVWTVRDSREDFAMARINTAARGYFNDNTPFALTVSPIEYGAFTNSVSVASGAKLDLLNISEEKRAISGLKVDLGNGAGTIAGFRPAAGGTLELTNITDEYMQGGRIKSKIVLPVTLENASALDNILSWKVVIDGKVSAQSSIILEDGNIVVRSWRGWTILVR